jgi:hypothetical protein
MFRIAGRLIFLCALTALAVLGWRLYLQYAGQDLRMQALEQRADELQRVIDRLNASRRVARVVVLDQKSDSGGQLHSTLLWMENDAAGNAVAPKQFTILGDEAHFEAELIQFDRGFVEAGDALRGHSIGLFTVVYGSHQAPADGFPIDTPGEIPAAYRDDSLAETALEQSLWQNFWRLYDDADYRRQMGVRLAEGVGAWGKVAPGQVYTISVEANGGMDMSHEAADPLYLEALKRAANLE